MLKTVNEKINKIRFNSTWEEAVFKATKSEETPPKRKHLRNLILRSWEVRGADDFFRELSSSNRCDNDACVGVRGRWMADVDCVAGPCSPRSPLRTRRSSAYTT